MFALKSFRGNIALVSDDGSWSYDVLDKASGEISTALPPRSLVFLLCKNTPAMIAGYLAFIRRGVVPVMLDADLDEGLLAALLAAYRPSFAWAPTERASAFPAGVEKLRREDYVLLDLSEEQPYPLHDDLALLMTTSGSTGSPKLVRLSYENLRANMGSIVEYLGLRAEDRAITNLPLHYVYGLSVLHTHLAVGASVVVTERTLFEKEFWQLVREYGVTNLSGVPYTYAMMKRLRFFRMDLPKLRMMTQAGGKLAPALHEEFAAFAAEQGKAFVVMYGAAEATARMGYLPPELASEKVGAMGIAIPGGRFELMDEEGAVIEGSAQTGELVYYGSNVMMGYAECGEDLAQGDMMNGRYETGDMAQRDETGCYTIVGRRRRFLKMFGKRTNLQEVEDILRGAFPAGEIACAGVDDHLYVFVTEETSADEIKPFLSQKIGLHPTAIAVKAIAEMPKNPAGKTLYHALEAYYDV